MHSNLDTLCHESRAIHQQYVVVQLGLSNSPSDKELGACLHDDFAFHDIDQTRLANI